MALFSKGAMARVSRVKELWPYLVKELWHGCLVKELWHGCLE